jgi:hypothetical protein
MAYEPGAAARLLPGSVTKVMSEFLAPRNYRWQCSKNDPTVDRVALARFAQDLAESADHGEGRAVVAQWGWNRFGGPVSGVVRDSVMAEVEIQAGQPAMLAVAAV